MSRNLEIIDLLLKDGRVDINHTVCNIEIIFNEIIE